MISEPAKFDRSLKIISELSQIQDLDLLLEQLLTEARNIVDADAGSIYLIRGTTLDFSYTQNATLQKKLPFGKKLIYSTFSLPINNESIAGYVANTGILVNITDAYHIDNHQPYSFDKHFDETSGYRIQSILSVPIKTPGGKVTGVIQLINALNVGGVIRSFTKTEESIVQLFADSAAITMDRAQMTRAMITRMSSMVTLHDPDETVEHANRVAAYAVEIYESWARKKGIPIKEIQHNRDSLRMAAMFHDIGKISVPAAILQKKAAELSPEELLARQQHTVYGARLFSDAYSDFEKMARTIALNHHENWGGTGYPGHINIDTGLPLPGYEKSLNLAFGKSKQEIPIYGRFVALANNYDMLTYKNPAPLDHITKDQAVKAILAGSGSKFDPEVVTAFASGLDVIDSIGKRYQK